MFAIHNSIIIVSLLLKSTETRQLWTTLFYCMMTIELDGNYEMGRKLLNKLRYAWYKFWFSSRLVGLFVTLISFPNPNITPWTAAKIQQWKKDFFRSAHWLGTLWPRPRQTGSISTPDVNSIFFDQKLAYLFQKERACLTFKRLSFRDTDTVLNHLKEQHYKFN